MKFFEGDEVLPIFLLKVNVVYEDKIFSMFTLNEKC